MGYMTITDEEAYNTAIQHLKGVTRSNLNFAPHTGGYVYPGKNTSFSHDTPNPGSAKTSSSMQIDIKGLLKLDEVEKEYSDLEEFYRKPASKDTITSEEARKRRKELEAHIQNYIKPEHRTYRQQINKAKTAEEL